jgi:hypothetical protein
MIAMVPRINERQHIVISRVYVDELREMAGMAPGATNQDIDAALNAILGGNGGAQ